MTFIASTPIANGTAVPSAETIAAVTPAVFTGPPGQFQNPQAASPLSKIAVKVSINLTPGASTTAVVAKVYRGGVISAPNLLATATLTLAAGNSGTVQMEAEDSLGGGDTDAGTTYSVSLTQTGGAANGAVNVGRISVEILP